MTMNNIEIDELLKVLESIRSEKYPNIPADLIKGIVSVQFESQDDRTQGHKETKKLIDDFLKEIVITG
ncbi:hypothetical protein AGMMS50276_31310 [Synergistales bacterium]|nr:hypothetical protein AGMMS50276_31310 [Synergistales bacterium]